MPVGGIKDYSGRAVLSRKITTAKQVFRDLAPHLPGKNHIYHLALKVQPRKNTPYTQFYRFPHQYDVITDVAVPYILEDRDSGSEQDLDIVLFGCSTGAEPYSLASVLLHRMPELSFHIRAFDCVPELVERAEVGTYEESEIYQSPFINSDFIDRTLDAQGDRYTVKEAIQRKVTFGIGDVLDGAFMERTPQADLVFAQNFLFHLKRSEARKAFFNLRSLLKVRSGLAINGMDYDMRIDLTKTSALAPVSYLIEEVHNDAFANAGSLWFTRYYGRLPFSTAEADWVRKFSTVFLTQE